MDEVLVDFSTPLLEIYNRRHGWDEGDMVLEDITEWELKPELKEIFLKTEGFFAGLQPLYGAIEGFKYLDRNHDVIIATSPSYNGRIASEKLTWMEMHLPDHMDQIVLTHNKGVLLGDLIIDDSVRFLDQFDGIRMVMDRPWNRTYDADYRVWSWNDILYWLEGRKYSDLSRRIRPVADTHRAGSHLR